MEVLIAILVATYVVKNGVVDASYALRGRPSPRHEVAKAKYAARAAKGGSKSGSKSGSTSGSGRGLFGRRGSGPRSQGPAGRYMSQLWADSWDGVARRHARRRDARMERRAQSAQGAARTYLRGFRRDAGQRVWNRWDSAWDRAELRRRARTQDRWIDGGQAPAGVDLPDAPEFPDGDGKGEQTDKRSMPPRAYLDPRSFTGRAEDTPQQGWLITKPGGDQVVTDNPATAGEHQRLGNRVAPVWGIPTEGGFRITSRPRPVRRRTPRPDAPATSDTTPTPAPTSAQPDSDPADPGAPRTPHTLFDAPAPGGSATGAAAGYIAESGGDRVATDRVAFPPPADEDLAWKITRPDGSSTVSRTGIGLWIHERAGHRVEPVWGIPQSDGFRITEHPADQEPAEGHGFAVPRDAGRDCSCGSRMAPVRGTVHADEGDGAAMVDLKCGDCGLESCHSWTLSDSDYESEFGHPFGDDGTRECGVCGGDMRQLDNGTAGDEWGCDDCGHQRYDPPAPSHADSPAPAQPSETQPGNSEDSPVYVITSVPAGRSGAATTTERNTSMSRNGSVPAGEATGLQSAIAYCTQTAEAAEGAVSSIDGVIASLQNGKVGGGVTGHLASAKDQFAAAAAEMREAQQQLESHTTVADAYGANPDAGDREFVTNN